jgi:hypothetical protein
MLPILYYDLPYLEMVIILIETHRLNNSIHCKHCLLHLRSLQNSHSYSYISFFLTTSRLLSLNISFWKVLLYFMEWMGSLLWFLVITRQITVSARSKAWTVFARPNTGIVASNPTQGMDVFVHVFCVCVVCEGNGLATGWSPAQGVLPTVY